MAVSKYLAFSSLPLLILFASDSFGQCADSGCADGTTSGFVNRYAPGCNNAGACRAGARCNQRGCNTCGRARSERLSDRLGHLHDMMSGCIYKTDIDQLWANYCNENNDWCSRGSDSGSCGFGLFKRCGRVHGCQSRCSSGCNSFKGGRTCKLGLGGHAGRTGAVGCGTGRITKCGCGLFNCKGGCSAPKSAGCGVSRKRCGGVAKARYPRPHSVHFNNTGCDDPHVPMGNFRLLPHRAGRCNTCAMPDCNGKLGESKQQSQIPTPSSQDTVIPKVDPSLAAPKKAAK